MTYIFYHKLNNSPYTIDAITHEKYPFITNEDIQEIESYSSTIIKSRHIISGPAENTMLYYEKTSLICKKSLFQLKSLQTQSQYFLLKSLIAQSIGKGTTYT